MLKIFSFSLLFITAVSLSISADGWRKNEMEIKVSLQNPQEIEAMRNLNLNGDVYTAYDRSEAVGIMYVTPEELEKISSLNLSYEIIINNLNEYYKDFWTGREDYYTYDQIIQMMNTLCTTYPTLCKKQYMALPLITGSSLH